MKLTMRYYTDSVRKKDLLILKKSFNQKNVHLMDFLNIQAHSNQAICPISPKKWVGLYKSHKE